MPCIAYAEKNLGRAALEVVESANRIISNYQQQGYALTLRQLYYQFVARDLIPNTQQSYKRLGSIINDARLAGLVDWEAIVDRTRNERANSHWGGPGEILRSAAYSFQLDKWRGQEFRPWVLIEKDALVGVIEGVCSRLDVPYLSCRGYTSQSTLWGLAQRLRRAARNGQEPVVFHLGDHDPSGVDMTRDIAERLELFVGRAVQVERLALNMDQVRQYSPPPNPAKITDSRAAGYIALHGRKSWELDALEPSVLEGLIEEAVLGVRDETAWEGAVAQERNHVATLNRLAREHA